jgi:hypothetical protein
LDRKLINYLPEVLRNFREFQKTFEAEEPEFENLQDELSKVLDDLFVEDATERGVKRWEKILKITPKATDSLEDRKFRIIIYITRKLPFTLRTLGQMLETLCGKNNYEIELRHNDYEIEVKINLADNNNIMDVLSFLKIVVPANLIQILKSYLTVRSTVPKYAIGGMSGEEITVYPWEITNIETIGKQYFGLGYQSAETIFIYPLQN